MSAINTELLELNFLQLIDVVAKTSLELSNRGINRKIIVFKDGDKVKKLQVTRREEIEGSCLRLRVVDEEELAWKIKELLESGKSFCLEVVGAKPVEWRVVN